MPISECALPATQFIEVLCYLRRSSLTVGFLISSGQITIVPEGASYRTSGQHDGYDGLCVEILRYVYALSIIIQIGISYE